MGSHQEIFFFFLNDSFWKTSFTLLWKWLGDRTSLRKFLRALCKVPCRWQMREGEEDDCTKSLKIYVFIFICGCIGSSVPHAGQWLLWWSVGSTTYGLSSWRTWVPFPRGMWDFPGKRIEPISPALKGRFLTTRPPGKPLSRIFKSWEHPVDRYGSFLSWACNDLITLQESL